MSAFGTDKLNRKEKEIIIFRYKKEAEKTELWGEKSVRVPWAFNKKTHMVTLSRLSNSEFNRLWELENKYDYLMRYERDRLEGCGYW